MNVLREAGMGERLSGAPEAARPDQGVVELMLLLPRWQADALESAARGRGLTAGQMLRRLVGSYCATLPAADR
jgi:hypothetical protein